MQIIFYQTTKPRSILFKFKFKKEPVWYMGFGYTEDLY